MVIRGLDSEVGVWNTSPSSPMVHFKTMGTLPNHPAPLFSHLKKLRIIMTGILASSSSVRLTCTFMQMSLTKKMLFESNLYR